MQSSFLKFKKSLDRLIDTSGDLWTELRSRQNSKNYPTLHHQLLYQTKLARICAKEDSALSAPQLFMHTCRQLELQTITQKIVLGISDLSRCQKRKHAFSNQYLYKFNGLSSWGSSPDRITSRVLKAENLLSISLGKK